MLTAPALAQPGNFGIGQGLGFGDGNAKRVSFAQEFETTNQPGHGVLVIQATIDPGWHIFSTTQKSGGPGATKIHLVESRIYQQAGAISVSPAPTIHREELIYPGLDLEEHYDRVTWRVPIKYTLPPGETTFVIKGVIDYQKCNPNVCVPSEHVFELTADTTKKPSSAVGASGGFNPNALEPIEHDNVAGWPVWKALVFGFLGGLVLNLMPCVLPVIGLKIFAFIEQSGQSRAKSFALNFWYSLGMIAVFMALAVLAVFAQLGWGGLFRYAEFNIALSAIVFTMGLSFLGVWEIPIPGFIGSNKVSEIGAKEGYEGAFAKGTITTLLATPCTGPFLGSALAWAVMQPAPLVFATFFAVGLGMASPYLVIGAFPETVRFLPKPGAWMDTFKQVMGFVLLGTVVYLLTLLEPQYLVPTIALLFALWMSCWWIGRVPITAAADRRWRAVGEATVVSALVGVTAFYWLAPVMNRRYNPEAARQLAVNEQVPVEDRPPVAELDWKKYTPETLAELLDSGKTVMVDFTANWCPNCKWLEAYRLDTAATHKLVDELSIVPLMADWSHIDKSPEVSTLLTQLRGGQSIPVLAVFPASDPQRPYVLRGIYSMKQLHDTLRKAAAGSTESGGTPKESLPDGVAKSGM
jgi:thiol:disulfide interchange protein DsbD